MKTRGSLARRVAVACGSDLASGLEQVSGLVRWHLNGLAARLPSAEGSLGLIGLSGSVAAGKTTLAHALCEALARDTGKRVAVVGTDGFLLPDSELKRRGMLDIKGFPATYDDTRLGAFVDAVRSGAETLCVPHYCHRSRSVTHHETVQRPDLLIVEGVIALRALARSNVELRCGIYLQASLASIESWYLERYRRVRRLRAQENHREETVLEGTSLDAAARAVWQRTNLPNLVEHIRPGRRTADLVVHKRDDHSIEKVWLRASE